MNTQGTLDYRVQIFRSTADGVARWKAYVVTIPAITAEGESREEVLEDIRRQIAEAVATSEFVKVPGPYDDFKDLPPAARIQNWVDQVY